MTEHRCLYAVVPHLFDSGRDERAQAWLRSRHGKDWYIGDATVPDWQDAYAAVDGFPPLDVLNMPDEFPPRDYPLSERFPHTVDLAVAWNEDEAAHIEAVTGLELLPGHMNDDPDTVTHVLAPDAMLGWPVGTVAARFTVTGCQRVEFAAMAPIPGSTTGGQYASLLSGSTSEWALYDDGWHWTGHAEKVNP